MIRNKNKEIDALAVLLLRSAAHKENEGPTLTPSPYFMPKLRGRILAQQNQMVRRGLGIEGTWSLLVASGIVAVALLIGGILPYGRLNSDQPKAGSDLALGVNEETAAFEQLLDDSISDQK